MPYFKWTGVDLIGKDHSGILIARSVGHLEAQLHKKEIGLVSCKSIMPAQGFARSTKQDIIEFFRQLAVLLESGVFLDQALAILAHQQEKKALKDIFYDLYADVQHGNSLGQAMMNYQKYFDPVALQVILSGHESGQFVQALHHLANHYQMINDFYKKLRSALMMPLITLIFFFVIAAIIFTVIIPMFAAMFLQIRQELPLTTKIIINISNFLASKAGILWATSMATCIIGLSVAIRYTNMRAFFDKALFHIPFLGNLIKQMYCAHFFASLSLLTRGGIQLVPALKLIEQATSNKSFKAVVRDIYEKQLQALPLEKNLQNHATFFPASIRAMANIGQESNTMSTMLEKIVETYQQHINKKLVFISMIIQPLVMIILGLLITILIFSIYLPIFNLSWSIS